jgi:hypothetical protein
LYTRAHFDRTVDMDIPWLPSVQSYTRLQLTFESDRLPAIAGVAKRYASIHGDSYVAGMWFEKLKGAESSFFWQPTRARGTSPEMRRQSRVPTWSWASICEPIEFVRFHNGGEWLIEFQGYVPVHDNDPFLDAEGTKLQMKGVVFQGRLHYHEDWFRVVNESGVPDAAKRVLCGIKEGEVADCRRGFGLSIPSSEKGQQMFLSMLPDYALDDSEQYTIPTDTEIVCLLVGPGKAWFEYGGLVLRCVDAASSTYQRIGTFTSSGKLKGPETVPLDRLMSVSEKKAVNVV